MRIFTIALLWYSIGLLFISCSVSKRASHSGSVLIAPKFFDTATHLYINIPDYAPQQRIWYKDSLVIEEVKGIYITKDTSQIEKRHIGVFYYTFMDLRTKSFYRYNFFSDTAKIIRKYIGPDSTGIDGPWDFYISHGKFFADSRKQLPDTTINGIVYNRVTGFRVASTNEGKTKVLQIGYLRCDKKNTMFQYDKLFGDKIGCPLVRIDDIPVTKQQGYYSAQIEFVSEKLTKEESKVFNAWEKNAKEYPINK